MCARQDHVQRRREHKRYRGCFFEGEVRWLGEHIRGGHRHQLRHATVAALAQQPVLRAEVVVAAEARFARAATHTRMEDHLRACRRRVNARAYRLDHAGDIGAQDARRVVPHR